MKAKGLHANKIAKGIKPRGDGVMRTRAQRMTLVEKTYPEHTIVKTTLYDLIEAISAEVKADEEDFIVAIVSHMFKSARPNIVMV